MRYVFDQVKVDKPLLGLGKLALVSLWRASSPVTWLSQAIGQVISIFFLKKNLRNIAVLVLDTTLKSIL